MTDLRSSSLNELWARLTVEELLRHGVDQFVLSPGSRCTPLTAAVAANERARSVIHFDERGAGFFALGYARATGKPAVLICTSGTATANYYPAVIEAAMDLLPMIILTADRPEVLRDTGANQTIDQRELYGKYSRYHLDLPCPNADYPAKQLLAQLDRAVATALSAPRGPVHINCQYDEPLAPLCPEKPFGSYLSGLKDWIDGDKPYVVSEKTSGDETANAGKVASIVNRADSGLLVVGNLHTENERRAVTALADKLKWPVFADIRSGLRRLDSNSGGISYFDQLLLSDKCHDLDITTVLHLGGMMTSKRYRLWAGEKQFKDYVHVADHPFAHDPGHKVTLKIQADISRFCEGLAPFIEDRDKSPALMILGQFDDAAAGVITDMLDSDSALSEPSISRTVSRLASEGTSLFLGSSMPIRDMDMFADPSGKTAFVTGNRGASGIDGAVATAAGVAKGTGRGVTALIGDLSFLHDLNSLSLLRKDGVQVTVIVINNHGGGIFSFLPVAECTDIFEPYFGTPHDLTFEKAAGMFDLPYFAPNTRSAFVESLRKAQSMGRSSIIEITTNRGENRILHDQIAERIKTAIDKL